MRLAVISTEDVRVPVTATIAGVPYNPSSDAVAMAFVAPGSEPGTPDWHTASWEVSGNGHNALCLVGPTGGVVLAVGSYEVWVKVTDNPEVPARPAGVLIIY